MVIRASKFNLYLLLALVLCLGGGCQTGRNKKPLALIHFHMETPRDGTTLNQSVPIYRAKPVYINVETSPFLTEKDVIKAHLLVDTNGGFMIGIQFNAHGGLVLEQYTAENPGKRIAIFCTYGKDLKQTRWLAAPVMSHRVATAQIAFTPDATREESELIVDSINNQAAKLKTK